MLAATLCHSGPARGQRDLSDPQSDQWYVTQGAVLGGATVANALALTLWAPDGPRVDAAFGWERRTERNFAPTTSHISDGTLIASVVAPVGTLSSHGVNAWGNALLVYGEALEGTLLLNTVTKKAVGRARPYTHHPAGGALAESKGADAHYSFYSGHSALSFTSAAAGSYLFSALHDDSGARALHWATAFTLASFTAHARVRAGRHYPTDVLVGSALGLSWGLVVPVLHDVRPRLGPVEAVAGAGGMAAGAVLATILPRRAGQRLAACELGLVPAPGGAILWVAWPERTAGW